MENVAFMNVINIVSLTALRLFEFLIMLFYIHTFVVSTVHK